MAIAPATIELYEEHALALIGYAVILVGHSDAEDLVADAMVRGLSDFAVMAARLAHQQIHMTGELKELG